MRLSAILRRMSNNTDGLLGDVDDATLTIDVLTNHLELHIESKRVKASCIRFYRMIEA